MSCEPDHLLLRRYADARDRGDLAAAGELWNQLAVNNFDRVTQIVKAFRFSPGGPGLPDHEWGSAASEAYLRVVAMGASFREREVGQLYAALVTCVQNACRDYGRKELRHQKRAKGSLDQTYEPDGEAGPFDAALIAYDEHLRERTADAIDEESSRLEAETLTAWAIGEIANDNYREVLELTYLHKIPAEDIANQLNTNVPNVYARRSRGIKELERILRDLRP
jgi:RNA polymerase sigma factor (sigma-70 family)